MKIYRLLPYEGDSDWLDIILQKSLNNGNDGVYCSSENTKITSKIISTFEGDYLIGKEKSDHDT